MLEVKFKLFSKTLWEDRIESLVHILDKQTIFRPDKWGRTEPQRRKFTIEDLPEMQHCWNRYTGFSLKKRNPPFWMYLMRLMQIKKPNEMVMGIDESFFDSQDNVQAFLDFASTLFEWGDMIYGYACHEEDFERKNVLTRPTLIDGKLIAVGGMNIHKCLPGIYWANFFGKTYVEWFGEERIRSSPCYAMEDLPGGGILILTAHSPLAYDKAQQFEGPLRSHLSEDAFFDITNPTRPCRSPFEESFGK